jgi:hypothetical protein
VRFRLEQRIPADADAVQAAVLEPGYFEQLATLPKLGNPELLSQHRTDDDGVAQRVRYAFVGELSGAVRKVVDPDRLTWVEESEVEVSARTTRFKIVPDHYASLLSASGVIQVIDDGEGGSIRTASGEVSVRMPLVGSKVERAIVSGLEEHAAAEEAALRAWLANR